MSTAEGPTADLNWLTATDAAQRICADSLSASAFARACLDRCEVREPQIRAWAYLDPELVMAQAQALDCRASQTQPRGSLHGVPVGVKDVILTFDQPTQYNATIYEGFHPGMDAACVMTLRAAGALIFGKTETVEFAATGRVAPTRNPHDLQCTPGGSSSGSAAAVADGHVPVSIGTQTGGSIIRPASYCGVYAMKPTWNLVSREGARMFAATLDTVGWFARSAQDLKLVYDVFDADPANTGAFEIRGARIAMCRSPAWPHAEAATHNVWHQASNLLRQAGAELIALELPPVFESLLQAQRLIMRAEARSAFLGEYRRHPRELGPSFREQVENVDRFSREQLCSAYDVAAECRHRFDQIARCFDIVLTPSTVGEAPRGLTSTGDYCFNAMWTLLHVPCVNLPGLTSPTGMPVGLTLTGPRFADRKLLAAAATIGPLFAAHRPHGSGQYG